MVTRAELKQGISSVPEFINKYGLSGGLKRWSGIVYHQALTNVDGRSIFEEDWEVCVILDACRADELERYCNDYNWLNQVNQFPSLASCTWNWLPRTIEKTPDHELAKTTYVSANPFSKKFCSQEQFHELDYVWEYKWNKEMGTVYPRAVTDRAIHHWRNTDTEKLLVHYIQPHVPFLSQEAESLSRKNFSHDVKSELDAWDRVTKGDVSKNTAISRYRETLKKALDEVDLLLSNINADQVVITSDHGEAFGEWGIYGHPQGINLSCLTQVPWVETIATDENTHTPSEYEVEDRSAVTQQQQLQALGYTK